MFGLILTVTVLPPLETSGRSSARSGVGLVSSGFQPYSCRCDGVSELLIVGLVVPVAGVEAVDTTGGVEDVQRAAGLRRRLVVSSTT